MTSGVEKEGRDGSSRKGSERWVTGCLGQFTRVWRENTETDQCYNVEDFFFKPITERRGDCIRL